MKSLYSAGVLVGLTLFLGCGGGGDDADRVDVYKASGKITMGGAPVSNATVTFSPKDKQPLALARTDSQGQFSLTTYAPNDGAAAGEYVVLVTKSAGAAPEDSEDAMHEAISSGGDVQHAAEGSPEGDGSDSLLPEKYSLANQSDLTATIKSSGENTFDFDLKP